MRTRHGLLANALIWGALACAGCGSANDVNVIRDDVRVIRGWAQAVTADNLTKAASYFALPAIVQNGTPPVRLTSRAQAFEFNELLPCGARLVATARHGAYIYATFRLVNRVGGGCGAGEGLLAATAFLIRNGKIAQWRRLPNPGNQEPPRSAPTPTPSPGQHPTA